MYVRVTGSGVEGQSPCPIYLGRIKDMPVHYQSPNRTIHAKNVFQSVYLRDQLSSPAQNT